ncbi:MAG TPA: transglycosylase SLT domain-containing protein [Desulfomonilaceae bacterium]|nr:transglycosylase SLT domain-containing protein [Desulfomonilaceae bacterium]
MIPDLSFGIAHELRFRLCLIRPGLMIAVLCMAFAGCSSTATIVKDNLDCRPAVANALSRAIAISPERKKTPAPTATTYPPLPSDENAPRVRRFIREYAYEQRDTMKRYLASAGPYLGMVREIIQENGLPQDIAYLFMLESGANPEARSPANALGMWQFMPATARSYGLRVDSWVDERLDPRKSTKAAMLYLKDLYGMFGCWRLALSAYNSGENKLNQVLCQEDADDYDEICASRKLKRETREFFPRFQAMAHIAKNPGKFGFTVQNAKFEEPKGELIPIEACHSLEALARAMGSSHSVLCEMNPALIRGATPPGGDAYNLRVPMGKKQMLAEKLKDLPEEQKTGNSYHIVHKGDNLGTILKRYGTTKRELASLNPDVNLKNKLRTGEKIVVPVRKAQTKVTSRKTQRVSALTPTQIN